MIRENNWQQWTIKNAFYHFQQTDHQEMNYRDNNANILVAVVVVSEKK